jgi:hypothetical protein
LIVALRFLVPTNDGDIDDGVTGTGLSQFLLGATAEREPPFKVRVAVANKTRHGLLPVGVFFVDEISQSSIPSLV